MMIMEEIIDQFDDPRTKMYDHDKSLQYSPLIHDYCKRFGNNDDYEFRRKFFQNMSYEQFENMIFTITSILRSGHTNTNLEYDGHDKALSDSGIRTPSKSQKAECMKLLYDNIQRIINNEKLNAQESLIYSSLMFNNGIVLIHPFLDGNGRLSRILSYCMINGTPAEDILRSDLIGSEFVFKGVNWKLALDANYQRFFNYDKECYDGFQADIIESNQIGTARLYLEFLKDDVHAKETYLSVLKEVEGKTVLNIDEFQAELLNGISLEQKIYYRDITKKAINEDMFRQFTNAFFSEKPKTSSEIPYYTDFCFSRTFMGKQKGFYHNENAENIFNRVVSKSVPFENKDEVLSAINSLPLRDQLYFEIVSEAKIDFPLFLRNLEERKRSQKEEDNIQIFEEASPLENEAQINTYVETSSEHVHEINGQSKGTR